uniref:Cytochrome P450 n=1 Tax=Brachionus rotundiformis TaxID=96890 RepID=A0A5J6KCW3_9BILA|nr:cytochrome P450 [Brachionus rotundiformis]
MIKKVCQQVFKVNNSTPNALKSYADIPGPRSVPLLGSLFSLKGFGGEYNLLEFRDFQDILQSHYGNIVKWELFNQKNVYLYDPDLIRQAFKTDGNTPHRSLLFPILKLHKKLGIKSTLSNSQGERWRKLRSLSNPCMARPQAILSYLPNQNQVANELIDLIEQKFHTTSNSITYHKFDQILRLLALEYVSEIAFDKRLYCVDEKKRLADVDQLVTCINTFFIQAGRLLFSPPVWKYYPTKDWVEFEQASRYIYKKTGEYIHNAYEDLSNNHGKQTILKEFLVRKDKHGMSTDDVVGLMTDFLMAGVDTTATAIHYLLYDLSTNPAIQDKLYQEINQVVGNSGEITEDHLNKLKYLKCVVKESLRLHSSVPANSRILTEDTQIGDYLIPKGVVLVFCNSFISKSEKYFKNATSFNPDRWIHEKEINPYAVLSFGFGARMCIGRRIAEQEIYLTMIKLMQKYRVEYIGEKPGLKIGLVAAPNRPLDLNLHRR